MRGGWGESGQECSCMCVSVDVSICLMPGAQEATPRPWSPALGWGWPEAPAPPGPAQVSQTRLRSSDWGQGWWAGQAAPEATHFQHWKEKKMCHQTLQKYYGRILQGENMELETGQGQEADAVAVRLICRLSAQLSICRSNYLDVVKSQTLFFWPNLGKPLFIIFHHSLRLLSSSVHNIKIMGRENHTESETLKSST